jgi:hypothetical protein
MPHWQTVEHCSMELPFRHETIHERIETEIMTWFQQMNHFMNGNVFKTFGWFSG